MLLPLQLGRLFYVFVHLVQQYCQTSDIPDCPKVLTLYGLSNLVSQDEHSLDLMDPYQRDAKIIGKSFLPSFLPSIQSTIQNILATNANFDSSCEFSFFSFL